MVDFLKIFILSSAIFFVGTESHSQVIYGPLQAQNNLSDVDSASISLGNLGGSPINSPTFTGTVTIPTGSVLNTPASVNLSNATGIPYSSLPSLSANQLLGSLTATTPSGQSVPSCSASTNALQWTSGAGFGCNSSINAATLGGSTFASPSSIGSTTASTGAFTNLSSSGTVSGTGFSTYLASPPAIGGTLAASGSFTTLNASGNDSLLYQNSTNQSIPNNATTTITNWTNIFDRLNTNFAASTGIFTAPATAIYHVDAGVDYTSSTSSVGSAFSVMVVGNSVTDCTGIEYSASATSENHSAVTSCDVSLTSGQTIIIQTFQNSGGAVTLSGTSSHVYVAINRVP